MTNSIPKIRNNIPLRVLLVVPFMLQISVAVGLTGYLSLRNGQKAVHEFVSQLLNEANLRITLHLQNYLATSIQVTQANVDAVETKLLDLNQYEQAGHYFWKQLQIYKNVSYLSYTLSTGEYVGAGRWLKENTVTIDELSSNTNWRNYTYDTDAQGNRAKLIYNEPYDPRSEQWYAETIKAGKPIWNEVYFWNDPPDLLSISYSYPIYDRNHTFRGILGIDLILNEISSFLNQIKISPSAKTFIIERNGLLIGSSATEKLYQSIGEETQRRKANQSQDYLIQQTAQYLNKYFGDFTQINQSQQLEFKLKGDRYFIQVTPWQDHGLDWLVVVIVPQSDFMAQINANTSMTIWLCWFALVIAIVLGIYTSRWISRPILRLSKSSQAIASGRLDERVEVRGVDELEVLANSFNRMAQQLQESFASLELRVKLRTMELEEAKEAADAANRAKSQFLANMSHELRTPLNAILGFAEIMNRDFSLTTEHQENLTIISRSGKHLLELINNILSLAKIESGKITLQEHSFDFYSLIDSVLAMVKLKAEQKGIELVVAIATDVPRYFKTDEVKLSQVLINLLNNGIKFTHQGKVTLRVKVIYPASFIVERQTEAVTLFFEVQDTGAGIAKEEISNLFQPFVQTHTGRKSKQGTGLGLSISQKFIQLMGGEITVRSKVNQGTVFSFDLKAYLANAAEIENLQPKQQIIGLAPNQPKYRILVVDDRLENRLLLIKLLTPLGFEVQEASNGQEAVKLWQSYAPHLILMDLRMPVMDGYEAIKQIRNSLQGQATVIIALTASVFEEEQNLIISAGCNDFLHKPLKQDKLLEKIAQHLGVRYLTQDTTQIELLKSSIELEPLTSMSLISMSSQWIEQLHQAAKIGDDELIKQLIAQIPDHLTDLSLGLTELVNNFDFRQIRKLTQNQQ